MLREFWANFSDEITCQITMQPFETIGIPSPDECVGVAGLTVSLVVLTVAVSIHVLIFDSIWTWIAMVGGLLIGWVSVMYCVVWGQQAR